MRSKEKNMKNEKLQEIIENLKNSILQQEMIIDNLNEQLTQLENNE